MQCTCAERWMQRCCGIMQKRYLLKKQASYFPWKQGTTWLVFVLKILNYLNPDFWENIEIFRRTKKHLLWSFNYLFLFLQKSSTGEGFYLHPVYACSSWMRLIEQWSSSCPISKTILKLEGSKQLFQCLFHQ